MPFVWISIAALLALLLSAWISKRTFARVIFVNLACAVLVIGGAETYYAIDSGAQKGRSKVKIVDAGGRKARMRKDDDILGYALVPDRTFVMSKWYDGDLIYEATYSIGADGLRVPPPDRGGETIACTLFFGGSLTFGSGLDDDETLPYRVGMKTDGRYRIISFSNRGYGPHQMLAAIEAGIVDKTIDCRPRYAIYQAITGHGMRVLGRANWDRQGPRYEIEEQGIPVRRGNFDDPTDDLFGRRMRDRVFAGSFLYKELVASRHSVEGFDLVAAIADRSRQLIADKYPGTAFHVILRSSVADGPGRSLHDRLRALGLSVHTEEDIFPDGAADRLELRLSKDDGHPSALANEIVADYIVQRIVKD